MADNRSGSTHRGPRRRLEPAAILKALVTTVLLQCGPVLAEGDKNAGRCAAYDIHFRTLLEDLAETGEASQVELSVAAFLNWQAWHACLRRDYATAFEAYEAIDLPTPSQTLLEDTRAAHWLAGRFGSSPR